ncbi:hypothetical protein J2R96_008175 [Bradyrhizobium elkanii]|nr:hypothetical protein [Bradyrhizobium elkanii]
MSLSSYSTGTVTIAANGTTVTGAGVIWSDVNALPGDVLQVGDFQTVITDKTDTSHLIVPPWGGGAQAGAVYTIWKVSPLRFAGAQAMQFVNDLVAKLNSSGLLWYLPEGYTDPNDIVPAMTADDGQGILRIDTGSLWVMQGGTWVPAGTYKGFQYKGAYNPATSYVTNDVLTSAGNAYIVKAPTTGHAPPNATYYDVFASKGDTGATGPTGATGAGYGGASSTSLAIGAGTKAFSILAGFAYQNGARVRASSAANTSNWMEGLATYSGTVMTIAVDKFNGAGTFADWNFNVVGQPGAGDLSSANNLSDVASPKTAKDNLSVHGADVASAATINLEAATGDLVDVTGTTTINFITLSEGHERTVRFAGALTLTHGASLLLPSQANITTAAGDFAVFRGYASGVVRCVGYSRFNGTGLVTAAKADQITATSTVASVVPAVQQYHPSSVKAWAWISNSGAIATSYNVSSVTKTGTGQFTVNFTVPFATANYVVSADLYISASSGQVCSIALPAAGSCSYYTTTNTGTVTDTGIGGVFFMACGTQ